MSTNTLVQQKLDDLLAGFLARKADTQAAGITAFEGEVTPYEAGPVQPLDPKLAWDEAQAALTAFGNPAPSRLKAPPHWSQLVASHESIVAIAFAVGNFPQLMRNFQTILALPSLSDARPTAGRPAAAGDLLPWAHQVAEKKQIPDMLLALGALRLARHFDAAEKFVAQCDGVIPAEWHAGWENEKAALAWHQGRADDARRLWDAQADSLPVLFNRGMAALFANDLASAKKHLTQAVSLLPASSAWHHLGRLYLTLTDLRRA